MGKLNRVFKATLYLLSVGVYQASFATLVVPRGLSELKKTSPIVLHGRVQQITESPVDGRRFAEIEVIDLARAPAEFANQKLFVVPLENRVLPDNDTAEVISSAPEFRPGEETLLFLRPLRSRLNQEPQKRISDGQTLFSIEGFFQGKFAVGEDRLGVRRILAWNQVAKPVGFDANEIIKTRALNRDGKTSKAQNLKIQTPLRIDSKNESDFPLLSEVLESARGNR